MEAVRMMMIMVLEFIKILYCVLYYILYILILKEIKQCDST